MGPWEVAVTVTWISEDEIHTVDVLTAERAVAETLEHEEAMTSDDGSPLTNGKEAPYRVITPVLLAWMAEGFTVEMVAEGVGTQMRNQAFL